jgi:beta-lactamase class A
MADARLPIGKDDPVGHSPAVRARLDAGQRDMTILDLCEAAQTQSDNGASNILLRKLGGPAVLTAFWRTLGDGTSRLDRYEPALNTSHGGDPRDTTSAAAMARSLHAMLAGPLLKPASRERLIGWTVATQTGLKRLRGGLPAGWRAGDKTGTNVTDGSYADKYNDIAICWHPGRVEPFLIAAFLESAVKGADGIRAQDEAVLAQAGRIAGQWIATRA